MWACPCGMFGCNTLFLVIKFTKKMSVSLYNLILYNQFIVIYKMIVFMTMIMLFRPVFCWLVGWSVALFCFCSRYVQVLLLACCWLCGAGLLFCLAFFRLVFCADASACALLFGCYNVWLC